MKSKGINNVETDIIMEEICVVKINMAALHDRIKTGSGKAAMQYPAWYHVINPVFSGIHAEVELSFRNTPLNDESECESESESDAEPHENTEGIEETEGLKASKVKKT